MPGQHGQTYDPQKELAPRSAGTAGEWWSLSKHLQSQSVLGPGIAFLPVSVVTTAAYWLALYDGCQAELTREGDQVLQTPSPGLPAQVEPMGLHGSHAQR